MITKCKNCKKECKDEIEFVMSQNKGMVYFTCPICYEIWSIKQNGI